MKIGDRVIVDATATGDGVHHHGVIVDIYEFARTPYVDVKFDEPDGQGRPGIIVTNIRLMTMEYKPVRCHYRSCAYPFRQCSTCDANRDINYPNPVLANPHGHYQAEMGYDPYVKLGAKHK